MSKKLKSYILAVVITILNIAFIITLTDRVNVEGLSKQSIGASSLDFLAYLCYYSLLFSLGIMLLVLPISLLIDTILKKININKISISLLIHLLIFPFIFICLYSIMTDDEVIYMRANDWYLYGLFTFIYIPIAYRGLLYLFQKNLLGREDI